VCNPQIQNGGEPERCCRQRGAGYACVAVVEFAAGGVLDQLEGNDNFIRGPNPHAEDVVVGRPPQQTLGGRVLQHLRICYPPTVCKRIAVCTCASPCLYAAGHVVSV